jgi:hypothetical protein
MCGSASVAAKTHHFEDLYGLRVSDLRIVNCMLDFQCREMSGFFQTRQRTEQQDPHTLGRQSLHSAFTKSESGTKPL